MPMVAPASSKHRLAQASLAHTAAQRPSPHAPDHMSASQPRQQPPSSSSRARQALHDDLCAACQRSPQWCQAMVTSTVPCKSSVSVTDHTSSHLCGVSHIVHCLHHTAQQHFQTHNLTIVMILHGGSHLSESWVSTSDRGLRSGLRSELGENCKGGNKQNRSTWRMARLLLPACNCNRTLDTPVHGAYTTRHLQHCHPRTGPLPGRVRGTPSRGWRFWITKIDGSIYLRCWMHARMKEGKEG